MLPYILICALSLKLLAPLVQTGFFEAHDALGHIYHSIEFNECLRQGVLLPDWFPDMYWGYGGPIMTFYPPLFYYSVFPLYVLTGSYFAGIKIAVALGIVLSGIFMYLFAREYWGRAGAVLSTVAYMYAPFHITDIYVRGAFPEAFLYPLLPAVFLLAKKMMTTGRLRTAALLSLLLGLSFLTHIMGFFALAFLVPFALLAPERRNKRGILLLAAALVLALGCTAFYWLPAFLQKSYTHIGDIALSQYDWREHFVYPFQLVSPSWGWGDSLAGPKDGMSFQIGIAHITFILISIGALPFMRSGQRRVSSVFLALTLISVFMMLPLSSSLWSKVPFLEILQFPWRLLLFVNLFTSFLAGAATCVFGPERKGARWITTAAGIVFVLAASWNYCRAIYPNQTFGAEEECTPRDVLEKKMGSHELQYLPIRVHRVPEEVPSRKVVLEGAGEAEILESSVRGLAFRYSSPGETLGTVKIFYYPSWASRIDGQPHPLEAADQTGEILIRLPEGNHKVTLRYTTPPMTILARIISLVSVLAVCALILVNGKRK